MGCKFMIKISELINVANNSKMKIIKLSYWVIIAAARNNNERKNLVF